MRGRFMHNITHADELDSMDPLNDDANVSQRWTCRASYKCTADRPGSLPGTPSEATKPTDKKSSKT